MPDINMIEWQENDAAKKYSTGVEKVALFLKGHTASTTRQYGKPIAFNGVTAFNESPSGAESNKIHADDQEYLNLISNEEFGATLEAYQKPDLFDYCEGIKPLGANREFIKVTQQERDAFGIAYITLNGDAANEAKFDENNPNFTLHLVYECKAGVSSRDHATVNDSPEAATNSWEISTTKKKYKLASGIEKNLATLEIDCAKVKTNRADNYVALMNAVYGTSADHMPEPDEIYSILTATTAQG